MLRRMFVSLVVIGFFSIWLAGAGSAQSTGTAARLSLKGYDPVAYFTEGKPVQGKADLETVFDGTRYRFSSADNLSTFKSDPDKYAPQFAGSCANGISRGMKVEADPLLWKIVDGKLYVFAGGKIPDQMATAPAELIEKARSNWAGLKEQPYQ